MVGGELKAYNEMMNEARALCHKTDGGGSGSAGRGWDREYPLFFFCSDAGSGRGDRLRNSSEISRGRIGGWIMLRIGMLTSGGDCQALNAAMRGVVKGICSKRDDVEIFGFQDGYKGLIYGDFKMLTSKDFSGILTQQGGTILGTSRQPFKLMRGAGRKRTG